MAVAALTNMYLSVWFTPGRSAYLPVHLFVIYLPAAGLNGLAFGAVAVSFRSTLARLIAYPVAGGLLYLLADVIQFAGRVPYRLTYDGSFQTGVAIVVASVPGRFLLMAAYEILRCRRARSGVDTPFVQGLVLFAFFAAALGGTAVVNLLSIDPNGTFSLPRTPSVLRSLTQPIVHYVAVYLGIWWVWRRGGRVTPSPSAALGIADVVSRVPAQRDLRMEAHLSAVAIWFRVWAHLGAGLVALILVLSIWAGTWRGSAGFRTFGWTGVVLGLLFVALGALGYFLARYGNDARLISSVIALLFFVYSVRQVYRVREVWDALLSLMTFVSAAALTWLCLNRRAARICTDDYREQAGRLPAPVRFSLRSPFFWGFLLFTLVGLGLCL